MWLKFKSKVLVYQNQWTKWWRKKNQHLKLPEACAHMKVFDHLTYFVELIQKKKKSLNSLIENVKCDYNNIISITHFDLLWFDFFFQIFIFILICWCICCYILIVRATFQYDVFKVSGKIIKTESVVWPITMIRASKNNNTMYLTISLLHD